MQYLYKYACQRTHNVVHHIVHNAATTLKQQS